MDTLLLHVCCGPCSTVPLRLLSEEGLAFASLFFNPNIDSQEEYQHRLDTFRTFAATMGIKVIEEGYHQNAWQEAIEDVAGVFPLLKDSPEYDEMYQSRKDRCRVCYAFRFNELAKTARDEGYEGISTTLSISPYQFTEVLAEELGRSAKRHGVKDAFVDYHSYYPETVRISRELGMYRQDYCGCTYSFEEARLERQARREYRNREGGMTKGISNG